MAQSMRCGPCRSEPPSIVFESDQRKGREIPLRLIQNGESSRRGQASTRRSSPSTPSPRDSRASAGPSERRVPLFGRSLERDSRALNARFVSLFPSFFVSRVPNVHFFQSTFGTFTVCAAVFWSCTTSTPRSRRSFSNSPPSPSAPTRDFQRKEAIFFSFNGDF